MAAPILLVDDNLKTIADLRRLLAREGYEVVLATSAADAVIAFGHLLPGLVLLAPSVESGRGDVVLEELKRHPDAALCKVILLGESVPGFGYPVVPLPPDEELIRQINEQLSSGAEEWKVRDAQTPPPLPPPKAARNEDAVPDATDEVEEWRELPSPAAVPDRNLEGDLFGDLEQQFGSALEAEAMASLHSRLAKLPPVEDLARFEKEVRAEAERRRGGSVPISQVPLKAEAEPASRPSGGGAANVKDLQHQKEQASARLRQLEAQVAKAEARLKEGRTAWEERQSELKGFTQRAFEALEAQRAKKLAVVEEQTVALDEVRNQAAEAEISSQALREQLERTETENRELKQKLEKLEKRFEKERTLLAEEKGLLETNQKALSSRTDGLNAELQRLKEQASEAQARVEEVESALKTAVETKEQAEKKLENIAKRFEALENDLLASMESLEQTQKQLDEVSRRSHEKESELKAARETEEQTQQQLKDLSRQHALAKTQLQSEEARAKGKISELEAKLRELEHAKEQAELTAQEFQRLVSETIASEQKSREAIARDNSVLADELDVSRRELARLKDEQVRSEKRAADAEAMIEQVEAQVRELEDRAVLPMVGPGKVVLGVPRTGTVNLAELAQLVSRLVIGKVEVKLELAVTGGTRNLWLKRGQLIAAESSLPYETLSDRARRDGLINARQEADLASVRGASAQELLQVMKQRQVIREVEVVGLIQRYTEAVALDAFTEGVSNYRLSDELVGNEVLAATATRPILPLCAEGLRRALPPELQLEALGGSDAVPTPTESELDIRELGFSERERRMLSFVDGEASIEDIVLATGIPADRAYKALAVAKHLGLITLTPPLNARPQETAELDVSRLESKYEQVLDADYFTILGLPKNAGDDEVRRAFDRLSEEFDPIRYSGHPDSSLQARAETVYRMLEEAVRALEDERRRAEYARHLLD